MRVLTALRLRKQLHVIMQSPWHKYLRGEQKQTTTLSGAVHPAAEIKEVGGSIPSWLAQRRRTQGGGRVHTRHVRISRRVSARPRSWSAAFGNEARKGYRATVLCENKTHHLRSLF